MKGKKQEQKFLLSDGTLLYLKGKPITEHNLTDKLAIEILKENPNRIQLFKKYPENWESLLKKNAGKK